MSDTTRTRRSLSAPALIAALGYIRDNLFRQSAAYTAQYWLEHETALPCEDARKAVESVKTATSRKITAATEKKVREAEVLDLLTAFQEAQA